eukprot:g325.t1
MTSLSESEQRSMVNSLLRGAARSDQSKKTRKDSNKKDTVPQPPQRGNTVQSTSERIMVNGPSSNENLPNSISMTPKAAKASPDSKQHLSPSQMIRLASSVSDSCSSTKIPRLIHKIWWQGERVVPQIYHSSLQSWKDKHPDWTVIVWDHKSIEEVIRQFFPEDLEMFNNYPRMIQKIDAAKYFILCHFGGVYTDMDQVCLRPIESIIDPDNEQADIVVSELSNSRVWIAILSGLKKWSPPYLNNAFIASKKQTWIWNYVIEHLRKMSRKKVSSYLIYEAFVLNTTGPMAFTKSLTKAIDIVRKQEKLERKVKASSSTRTSARKSVCATKGDEVNNEKDNMLNDKNNKLNEKNNKLNDKNNRMPTEKRNSSSSIMTKLFGKTSSSHSQAVVLLKKDSSADQSSSSNATDTIQSESVSTTSRSDEGTSQSDKQNDSINDSTYKNTSRVTRRSSKMKAMQSYPTHLRILEPIHVEPFTLYLKFGRDPRKRNELIDTIANDERCVCASPIQTTWLKSTFMDKVFAKMVQFTH